MIAMSRGSPPEGRCPDRVARRSRGVRRSIVLGLVLSAAAPLTPGRAAAQSYRGWTTTSIQVIELRPLGLDSVPRSEVLTDANGRFLYEGNEVSCVTATVCTGYLPLGDERTLAATQDLSLTLWGFGMEGLSVTTLLRARARAGGDVVWPRSDDEFDALLAYAQLERGPWRFRAGRMDVRSGLGFSGFDGGSVSYAVGSANLEAYGGRSLARGLREPQNEALRGLDGFLLDHSVLLVGGSVGGRFRGTTVTGRYQREILWDRSSLVSERASVDLSASLPRVRVTGSLDYDFSFERAGKGHLTLSAPIAEGEWLVELSARRYVPYFDLSTLWGFFEPVSYSEVLSRVGWSPGPSLGAWVSGGRRTYGDTKTAVILRPMRDTGWRADAGARWQVAPDWVLDGRYQLEWGPGGFLNSADAAVRYSATERLSASLNAMTFQQIEEYRLGEGRAFGGGASADFAWSERISISGGLSIIRHRDGGNVFTSPWNQGRAWTSLRLQLGRDPGLARMGGAG
jgi:hypothetical protein